MVRRLQLVWPMRAHTIIGVVHSEFCLGRWVSGRQPVAMFLETTLRTLLSEGPQLGAIGMCIVLAIWRVSCLPAPCSLCWMHLDQLQLAKPPHSTCLLEYICSKETKGFHLRYIWLQSCMYVHGSTTSISQRRLSGIKGRRSSILTVHNNVYVFLTSFVAS